MNEIYLYGSVGASWWEEDYFTPVQVREQLAQMTGPVTVRINSGGGIATDGQAIYTLLRDWPDTVDVVVDGVALSAASLIAMAGDTITMRAGSIMMIHDPANPWVDGRGTEDDHLRRAKALGIMSNAYAGIYAARAGITTEAARAVMREETYLDGPAAVAAGFATAVDEAAAAAAARFDYRVYGRAPEGLRLLSAGMPRSAEGRRAVLAMMAGVSPRVLKRKEAEMARISTVKPAMAKVEVAVEDEDKPDPEAEEEEDTEAGDKPGMEGADDDEKDSADDDEPGTDTAEDDEEPEARAAIAVATLSRKSRRARGVAEMCRNLQRPMTEALGYIARGMTAEAAGEAILTTIYKGDPMKGADLRGTAARITRDEGDVRRRGMAEALAARMGVKGASAEGPARPFMDVRMTDMAAAAMGRRAPADSQGRLRLFMQATHTTSDFAAIFENALGKRLQQAYAAAEPTYRAIAQRLDFTDYRPHPVAGVGEMTPLREVPEGGEIQAATFNDKRESMTLKAYGLMLHITEQMIVNDDLNAIAQMLQRSGMVVAANEDAVFYAMALGGSGGDGPTLGETSRQVFNTTDNTKAGTAAVINVASLTIARAAVMTKKSLGQLDLALTPSVLLVGPAKLTEAQQVVAPLQADQVAQQNPFAGTMKIVVTPKITGNAWYVFADPAMATNFAYGFLQGAEGPEVRNETPIGRLGVDYRVTHRFGCNAIDFRAGFKNAGA